MLKDAFSAILEAIKSQGSSEKFTTEKIETAINALMEKKPSIDEDALFIAMQSTVMLSAFLNKISQEEKKLLFEKALLFQRQIQTQFFEHPESIRILINHGLPTAALTANLENFYIAPDQKYIGPNFKDFAEPDNTDSKEYAEFYRSECVKRRDEIIRRMRLVLIFPSAIEKQSTLSGVSLKRDGAVYSEVFRYFQESFRKYSSSDQVIENKELMEYFLDPNERKLIFEEAAEILLGNKKEGNRIIPVHTKRLGGAHAEGLLTFDDWLMKINRGARANSQASGITIFQKSSATTEADRNAYYSTLQIDVAVNGEEFDRRIKSMVSQTPLLVLPMKDQKAGNCTWTTSKAFVQAAYFAVIKKHLKKNYPQENEESINKKALSIAKSMYKNFSMAHRIQEAKNYIETHVKENLRLADKEILKKMIMYAFASKESIFLEKIKTNKELCEFIAENCQTFLIGAVKKDDVGFIDFILTLKPEKLDKNKEVENIIKKEYKKAIQNMDIDGLLKILEIKKKYILDTQEKQLVFLEELIASCFDINCRNKERYAQCLNIILALLEKRYLDLNTIKHYLKSMQKKFMDLVLVFDNLKTTHLDSDTNLAIELEKDESFDQYLPYAVREWLASRRETTKKLMDVSCTGTDTDMRSILTPNTDLNITDTNGQTPLELAIKNGNITDECIIEMIGDRKIDLEHVYNHRTVIVSACAYKRDTLAAHLLSNYMVNLHVKDWLGFNILDLACQNGLQKTLKSLATNHSNVFHLNQKDYCENTLLMQAITYNQLKIITTLFDLQNSTNTLINLDLKKQDGLSALDIAAQHGNKEAIEHLFFEKKKRNSEYTIDALSSALMQAILNEKEGAVQMLLSTLPAQNLNYVDSKGRTLLAAAVEKNQLNIALELARKSEQPIENKTDNILKNVYGLKNLNKQDDISLTLFNLMLQKKYTDTKGETLILASQNGDIEIVASMCQQLSYQRKYLLNAAMAASDAKKNSTVLYLLEHIHKINPNNISHAEQAILDKIFLNAIKNDSVKILNQLLEQYKFSDQLLYNAVCERMKHEKARGYVSDASTQQAEEIALSILLKVENSKYFSRSDSIVGFGSILDFACYKKMDKLALTLLERTSDLSKVLHENSKSALFYACENGLKAVVATMMKKNVQVDQRFARYEHYDRYGIKFPNPIINIQTTPLLEALAHGHPDIALVLLEAGAKNFSIQYLDKNSRNSFYHAFNALSIAIEKGYIEVVKEIIKKSQEQNIEVYGRLDNLTHALQLASLSGNLELIDLIIDSPLYEDQKDPLKLLEESIVDIYSYSWQRRRANNSELSAKIITHLLERPFVCPQALYEHVIKNMDADTLFKLFETRKEYAPKDPEQKLAILEKLNASYREMDWRNDGSKTQYLNIVLELLEKEYLDLNSVENYLKSGRDTSGNLWSILGWHLETIHLDSHPKLAIALAKCASFDQYLSNNVCEQLKTIRKSLSQEEGLVHIHFQSTIDKQRTKPKGNEPKDGNSDTQKPEH